jgi:small subunit ribosomal protein S16
MVRIRLRKVGSRHQVSFRLVATDRESPRDGRFLELLGQYNPRTEPGTINLDEARVLYWLGQGAQPSESALKLLKQTGTTDRFVRLKQGESLDALVAEAKTAQAARVVSPKTRRTAKPKGQAKSKKSKKTETAAEAA